MAAPKAESSIKNLEEILMRIGVSPTKFAEDSKLDRATIEKAVNGKALRSSTIHRIREALEDTFGDRFSFELVDGESAGEFYLHSIPVKKSPPINLPSFDSVLSTLFQVSATDDVSGLEIMAKALEGHVIALRGRIELLTRKN